MSTMALLRGVAPHASAQRWGAVAAAAETSALEAAAGSAHLRNARNLMALGLLAAGDVGGARAAMVDATAAAEARARAGRGHDSFVDIGGCLLDSAVVALYAGDGGAADAALRRAAYMAERAYRADGWLRVAVLANLSVAAAHARDGDRAFALALDARRKLADARDFVPRGEDAEHASFAARLAAAHAVTVHSNAGIFAAAHGRSPEEGLLYLTQALDGAAALDDGAAADGAAALTARYARAACAAGLGLCHAAALRRDGAEASVEHLERGGEGESAARRGAAPLLEEAAASLASAPLPLAQQAAAAAALREQLASERATRGELPSAMTLGHGLVGLGLLDTDENEDAERQWRSPESTSAAPPAPPGG